MGLVRVKKHIGLRRESPRELEFLVDTGSFYTFLTPELTADMGITSPVTSEVILVDSRITLTQVGVTYLRLIDREGGIVVASMNVPMPLLEGKCSGSFRL